MKSSRSPFATLTHGLQIIEEIRHSVSVIKTLPPDVQLATRLVYYTALRYAFIANTVVAAVAMISAFFARGKSLNRS